MKQDHAVYRFSGLRTEELEFFPVPRLKTACIVPEGCFLTELMSRRWFIQAWSGGGRDSSGPPSRFFGSGHARWVSSFERAGSRQFHLERFHSVSLQSMERVLILA
jgi:hypothetical protein